MTIKKLNTLNSSNFANFGNPKVIKHYEETNPKLDSLGDSPHDNSAISFAKEDVSGINFDYPDTAPSESAPAEEQPLNPEERRAARRTEWKQAASVQQRAMQMQKDAEEKLKQARKIEDLLAAAKSDPTKVAEALGIDKTEFLRQYQNQMFNIPNEVQPKPEEEVQARLQRYEEERQREREQFANLQASTVKQTYVSTKILPAILGDKDKFEILNDNDPQLSAAFIYDMMNEHFQKTGEELNPLDVAEEMETILAKEMEERITASRKYKKFSKHFAELPEEPAQLGEHDPQPAKQLGDREPEFLRKSEAPSRRVTGRYEDAVTSNNSGQRDQSWASKRERKLREVATKVLGNR